MGGEANKPDGRTALYRHFGEDGSLLYVGISVCPVTRFGQHKERSAWFGTIKRVEVEWFETRALALSAKTEAIRSEAPSWNIRKKAPAKQKTEPWWAVQHFNAGRYDGWYRDRDDAAGVLEYFQEEFPREMFGLIDTTHTPSFFINDSNVLQADQAQLWASAKTLSEWPGP